MNLTAEDTAIVLHLLQSSETYTQAEYRKAEAADYEYMRDHADVDHFYLKQAVRIEAYAAAMYGTPEL